MPLTDAEIKEIVGKIKGVTLDSRAVKKNYLFAALPGSKSNGIDYITDAIHNGATIIIAPEGTQIPAAKGAENVSLMTFEYPRRVFSLIASAFYAIQPETIVAITGTSGKTSTAHFTSQLWDALGYQSASLGTLGIRSKAINTYGSLTTPDPARLHAELADLAAVGVSHVAVEASSHGIDQRRLDGVQVKAAGFTNLSRDHLDYHHDMENYFQAKSRLFSDLVVKGGVAVINADNEEGRRMMEVAVNAGLEVLDYGCQASALKVLEMEAVPQGSALSLEVLGEKFDLMVPLAGEFQTMNVLCAIGLVMAQAPEDKERFEKIIAAVPEIEGAPGRLQFIPGHPKGAAVYVDYAHKPDALDKVLQTLRPHVMGRLVCVVGCGGNRDKGKRPVMARIGAELSDHLIITDDNPRSEDPAEIRKDMLEGAPDAVEIGDRTEAIRTAVEGLEEGDVLVIAGKGHEQGQIIGGKVEPFDDVVEAKKAIEGIR